MQQLAAGFFIVGILAIVVILVVIGSGSDSESGGTGPTPADPFFGMNDSLLYSDAQLGNADDAAAAVQAMSDTGIGWVRFSAAWRGEQPTAPLEGAATYDFQFLDQAVATLAAEGMPMEITLTTTPVWAADGTDPEGCTANIRPKSEVFGDFAAYAAAVAQRYGPDGDFWDEHSGPRADLRSIEIWNEPNLNAAWCPEPQPEEYADMFVLAAKAIHAVEPDVTVVTGGLSSVFDDLGTSATGLDANVFMERAMSHNPELGKLADAIGFHVYAADVDGVEELVARFREGLDRLGLKQVPIEVNEVGWPTEGPAYPVAEEKRAELVGALAKGLRSSPCVSGMALYAWRTPETPPGASEAFYGVADPSSGELYPSATAYRNVIASAKPAGKGGGAKGC